jgi:hypothetical protein
MNKGARAPFIEALGYCRVARLGRKGTAPGIPAFHALTYLLTAQAAMMGLAWVHWVCLYPGVVCGLSRSAAESAIGSLRLETRQCRDQRIRVPPARPRLLSLLPLISPDLHVPRMVLAQQGINGRPCAVQVEAEIGGQFGRLIRPRPAAGVELLQ